jgi:hypothetical protein
MEKDRPGLLNPFLAEEAMLLSEAIERTGWAPITLRERAAKYGFGRKIGSRWVYSRAALELFLGGREEALSRYLAGDRSDPEIIDVFRRLNLPIELLPPPPSTRQRVRRGGGAHATA